MVGVQIPTVLDLCGIWIPAAVAVGYILGNTASKGFSI